MPTKLKKVYADTCVWGELISKPASGKRKAVEKITELAARRSIEVFISKYVLDEIEETPRAIRKTLLDLLKTVPHSALEETDEILYLAKRYVKDAGLTYMDAFHIATAVIYGMHVFLSFNRRTIVNKKIVTKLRRLNDAMGYKTPLLLTPEDFLRKD